MATYDELFGKKEYADKRPPAPKWANVGDSHDAVLTSEVVEEQQLDVGNTWNPMFLEKQADGKWKPKNSGELTEGLDKMILDQFVLPVKLLDGTDATFYFDNKTKKEALKSAMKTSGVPLVPGTGIRMTRTENVGRSFGWMVQLAAPDED
jgi:hypothetical protein